MGRCSYLMNQLQKVTYLFEYLLRITYYGDFSNGTTTMQCVCAPEFPSHSKGVRVKVE